LPADTPGSHTGWNVVKNGVFSLQFSRPCQVLASGYASPSRRGAAAGRTSCVKIPGDAWLTLALVCVTAAGQLVVIQ